MDASTPPDSLNHLRPRATPGDLADLNAKTAQTAAHALINEALVASRTPPTPRRQAIS